MTRPTPSASTSPADRIAAVLDTCRRRVLRRRRPLAALCAGGAVLAALHVVAPPPPATVPVLTAARDLPAGTVLEADDLVTVAFRPESVPDGLTAGAAAGRTLAAPLRRGEPLTDVRLVAPSLLRGYPGLVAVPVRVPDPAAVDLLRVGDRVDVVVVETDGASASTIASDVPVLALPRDRSQGAPLVSTGRLVVLGTPPAAVGEVSAAAVRGSLSVVLSR